MCRTLIETLIEIELNNPSVRSEQPLASIVN